MLKAGTLVLSLCLVQHCLAGVVWDVTPDRVQDNETVTLDVKLQLTTLNRYATAFVVYIDHFQHPNNDKIFSYDYNFTTWEGQCQVYNSQPEPVTCDGRMMRFEFSVPNVTNVGNLRLHTFIFGAPIGIHWTTIGFHAPTRLEILDPTSTAVTQVSIPSGAKYSMQCAFADGWGNKAAFRWFANTTNSTDSATDVTQFTSFKLTAESVRRSDHYSVLASESLKPGDEGTYRCEADDNPARIGRFQSQTLNLNVTYAPQTDSSNPGSDVEIQVMLGETVKVIWNVMANPKPNDTVTWSKEEATISSGADYEIKAIQSTRGFQYSIEFVAKEDRYGAYKCKVQNKLGKAYKTFVLRQTQTTVEPTKTEAMQPTKTEAMQPTKLGTAEPTKPGTAEATKPGTAEPTKPGTAEPTKPGTAEPTKSGTGKPTPTNADVRSTEIPPGTEATTEFTNWKRLYDSRFRDLRLIILILAIVFAILVLAMALGMFVIYKKMKNLYVREPPRGSSRVREPVKTRKSSRGYESPYYSNPTSIEYERFANSEDIQLGIQPPSHIPAIPERPDDGDDHMDTV